VLTGAAAPAEVSAALRGLGLRPDRWSAGPEAFFAEHTHPRDKVLFREEGSITFFVAGETWPLGPGDRIDLPAGTPHVARAGAHGVVCREAFRA
jgi:quercetin dioxygenase-like cupin family protein